MTTKKKKKESKREKRAYTAKLQWVSNNLSEERLKHADENAPNADALMEFFLQAIELGLSIKVDWDNFSECYQATAIGSWEGFPSSGYAVSARSARDPHDALALVWYKVIVMGDGDLSNLMTEKEEEDIRG